MDTVLQGLTQSPLVQKLSDFEHHAKRFTYDMPDNAPYRSFHKEEVKSYMGDKDKADSDLYFKIPRRGYLNRMYLKVQMVHAFPPLSGFVDPDNPDDFNFKPMGPEFFASWLQNVKISIGGKTIETLHAQTILFEVFKNIGSSKDSILHDMRGRYSNTPHDDLGDEGFDYYRPTPGIYLPNYVTFLIPLPFSLFNFHKDALDTNFLQPIEVVLKKQILRAGQHSTDYTRVSLVCKYHTFHNHFRNQIRNANFEREATSIITSNSHMLHAIPTITQVPAVPAVFSAFGRYQYSVQLDEFVSDILISFRKTNVDDYDNYTGEMQPVPSTSGFVRFILKAHDQIIFDKHHWEMDSIDLNASSNDIQDRCMTADSMTYYGLPWDKNSFIKDSICLPRGLLSQHGGVANVLYRIPLSLFSTDEFLSGGLNFGTLADVQLIIEGEPLLPEGTVFDRRGMEPQIIFRTKNMTRIDSKTGSVAV